ncbi:type II toxin-antitoxin system VapB family antitoxin [Candidatus Mycobacterium methanotrophicum]|uniref:Type II toxin-antitoxin system VapB family antitoxin n=1 Tax=Candidatus Mycobacterium methanotrophicum TaxID=2943498 RepID=A0ABY4QKH0_9MYCO|nr:type II toxin-antitoxin system VapB family antitoxin [Candidatus Mycobacterium methanotrophicum]UQX11532.1 type II toxin-antitoxin system VapB family antitoxin [Candidatus Mycobacterium methanotrophicum]
MRFVKVEIEIDQTLLDEAMQRYRVRSPREAVNLALRSLLVADSEADVDENDPFGLAALDPRRAHNAG